MSGEKHMKRNDFRSKQNKTITVTAIVVALLTVAITTISVLLDTQNNKIGEIQDPEIARSMEYEQVQDGDERVPQTDYVQFDAFFLRDLDGDGYAEQVRGTCREIGKTDTLYMDINVLTNGRLENGKVTINGSNMNLKTALVEDIVLKQNYISDNTTLIEFKTINNGTEKLFSGTVIASSFGSDTSKYSQVNSITLTGTHVADDGSRTEISKTVYFNVDWYGNVNAQIYNSSGTQYIDNIADENKENINLNFSVTTRETIQDLILKSAVLEGTIPELNGYKPTSVTITSSDVVFDYDAETGHFTASRNAEINEEGIVTKTISNYNTFNFHVTYPYSAYESLEEEMINLKVPFEAYYEGYNNPNDEFENPIKSNIDERTITFIWEKYVERPIISHASFEVEIGTYRSYDRKYVMSKEEPLKLYNGTAEETEDLYTVRWYAYTGNQQEFDSLQMKENSNPYTDRFYDGSTYYNMSDYTKNIGIYFSNASNILGKDGYIKVINDETGEEIHTFTSEDWGSYSSSSPYMYETPIKHIRIETSKPSQSSSLYVYNIKEIDDQVLTTTISREDFDKIDRVYTYLTGNAILAEASDYTHIEDDSAYAIYEEPISIATIYIDRDIIGTQNIEKDINIEITTKSNYYNIKGWVNGRFLVELPAEILDIQINNISSSDSAVKILAYEILDIDGKKFIKIETENETEATYTITVNTDITADPRSVTTDTQFKLYGYNEKVDNYYRTSQDIYDVDGDENTTELVNYDTDSLKVQAPSSLLTNQQATDYNEAGETAIAPQIATIDKTEADTATINVSIANNYIPSVSEIQILGKIPFEGNSFTLNGAELGSMFTTQMLESGITVPAELQSTTTVYYSENENPTNDINNPSNGWTTNPTDFSKVKTYLIDLGSYILNLGESQTFTYQIKVPSTVQYNDVSYSAHAVYFCLDTDQGKYKTQTETTKLGFRIERKYHLNLTKVKENTEIPVQGATFSVVSEDGEETRIGTTNNSGTFTIENLYVDKTYTLKEIRTPGSYESLDGEVQFKVVVEGDQLVLQILSGENILESHSIIQATTEDRGQVNFKIENTPKYRISITKKDQTDGTTIAGAKFRLEGEGLGTGIILTSNKEGVLTATGLLQDVEYTLTETEVDGYYVNETPIKFKVQNNGGNLSFVVTSGSFNSHSQVVTGTGVSGLDAQDSVTADLTNEKIPTYEISVKKYAKEEETTLRGAQYKITGEGIDEKGETYTTGEDGTLTIPGLYEYVEGKNITGVYTLEEITPPEGYALDSRQLQFRVQRNDSGELEIEVIGENFLRGSSVNGNTINLELDDEPLFKITKIDADTQLPIPNAKFVLIQIDENYEELGYAKDINGNVVGTLTEGIPGFEEGEVPVVISDENGEISYGLQTGLYKAIEVEAPVGYELPENEEDRTYYFGIGESKAQESEFGTSVMNQVEDEGWSKIESVINTTDNGYVIAGFFTQSADLNADGTADLTADSTDYSGFIAKYDRSGNFEFAKPVFSVNAEVRLLDVIQTNDGGYVAVGSYLGESLYVGDISAGVTNTSNNKKAIVIKFGSSGDYEWSKEIETEGQNSEATAVAQDINGNVVVGITTEGNPRIIAYSNVNGDIQNETSISANVEITDMDATNSTSVYIVSQSLTATTGTTAGRLDIYENGSITSNVDLDFNANAVSRRDDGNLLIVGNYTGTAQSTATKGNYDGVVITYDVNSSAITTANTKFIRGKLDDIVTSVKSTTDGGYIIGGYTYSSGVDLNNDGTNDITRISGNSDGYVIKYDAEGTQEWLKQVQGSSLDEVTGVTEREENEFIAVGHFNSTSVKGDVSDSTELSLSKYTDSFIFNYGEVITAPEVPESSEITVENKLKEFQITTDVEEVDGVKGGSISGEDQAPYETVKYGNDSQNEIKMVPDSGYKIVKITINDEEYAFTPADDGSVTLPQFTDVTTNKHIVVTFSNTASSVLVHHYIDGTETPVAPDDHIAGTIGETYTTAPHIDLEEYELKQVDGEYEIPDNASGVFTQEEQVVTYYYVKKQIPLTVHHYIEGTNEQVPLADGGTAQDEVSTGEIHTQYTTDALTEEELDPKYELSIVPENQNGTYESPEVVVTYYYKVKQVQVTTRVDGEGGSISGQNQTPYEEVEYGEDSTKEIIATPEEGYKVSQITVNGEPIEFEEGPDHTVELDKFIDMTEDKEVVVTFEQIPATVVIHHYIEGTTDKVPAQNGGVVEDETRSGHVGDMYASQVSNQIAVNYEYVSSTNNTSGIMTEDPIEVIYYYRIKQAGIEQTIDKTGSPDTVTEEEQKVTYNITYTGNITDYIGNAKVTIVDTLPFSIDTSADKSNLNGGSYDAGQNTITWEETIEDIDTFTDPTTGEISITKQITVTYTDYDFSKTSFENKVEATIELETTGQEEGPIEDKVTTNTNFRTEVTATKVWNHTNNIYGNPTQVELQVKNGNDVVARQVVNSSNKVGEDENTWSYTFTNLPKYDESGLPIVYTVDEAEVNPRDLDYYDKQIEGNTITNTYAGPIISAVKESATENGLAYVVEGETITYTITVTNDGGRDKVVTVQDSAPEGTTFKAGSIKVNGSGADNYTETNLNSGIQVNVPADGTTTVSFEVTVNPLQGEDLENLSKVIRNTATVDGEETEEVTDTVNKSKLTFNKTSESENRLDYVVEGEKITYTINLSNEGTAPTTTIVKDSAPEGTTFAQGSIVVKVDNVQINTDKTYTEEELEQGISVEVPAGKTASVRFQVTVNNLNDGTLIKNKATVGDSEEPNTNETEDKYVEPIISSEKTVEIEHPEVGYALEGETIKYTITVTNNGGLATDAIIKDTAPEGTTFVEGSIKVNGSGDDNYTETNLNSGIEVNVPAKVGTVAGTVSVSFEVRVNTLEGVFTKVIENTAEVDGTPTDEVEVTVNKPNVIASKESTPANGEKVRAGQEITYRIVLDNTQGTAPGTVKVQDTIPTGTTYKDNSIMLDGKPIENDETDLANGLNITVPAGEQSILSFTVTVNAKEELTDGYIIRNQARVEDTDEPDTNEVEHTYVEPIISSQKTSEILNVTGRDYALEGETIKYTITVTNNGGLSGDATITDTIPEGTTFVPGSIKVNGVTLETDNTETKLNSGIEVNVPAKEGEVAGTASISFEVTVNELAQDTYSGIIENTAHVTGSEYDQDVPSEDIDVKKPHIVANKTSDPANGTEVTQGNEITYYINVNNDGEAPTTVTVKDNIPLGTTFKDGSIKVEGSSDTYELADLTTTGIEIELDAKEDKTVEFTVTVNDLNNGTDISNIATVDDEQTNTVTHKYVEAIIDANKTATIEHPEVGYVLEGETITYTITVTNTGDLAKRVTVKDVIPTGTSFVENSIKIDNQEQTYTQTDLQNGINVDVPAQGNVVVTFEVTVNELAPDTYEGTITNKANVDGKDTNEVTEEVKKPHVTGTKTSTPASGSTVKLNDPITYVITLTNDGTAPETVTVRDEIPDRTTFKDESIKVQGDSNTYTIDDLTTYGINVTVPAGETRTVEFTVTVNDLDNGVKITNVAYVEGEETDPVEHTYVEAIIDGSKASETANGLDYVVEGEVITYTITASNTGDLDKNITISDQIPEGTTFVPESIKVNEQDRTELTQDSLASGIQVNVPARTSEAQPGTTSISFQVTVNPLDEGIFYKEIENTAIVDGKSTEPVINIVNKSDIKATKTSVPENESTVKAGETITYTINLTNDGTAPAEVTVKDEIPEGTTFKNESIKVNGQGRTDLDETDLESGIQVTVPSEAGETAGTGTVSFEVTVNDNEDGQEIKNKATVNDTPTNETIHKYVEPVITQEKSATTEHGLDYVVEGEKITYTITVKNDGGLDKNVVVKDELPAGTTFVEGSIKVNGLPTQDTEDNLKAGITVNVPEYGETTVSFDVTVDPLEGEDLANLSKEILNTALVDDNPTNEVTETVNKADVKYSKSSIPEAGSTVTANNEITYIITLDNSTGKAPATVVVKDNIPTGTTFVPGSIKVKDSSTGNSAEELASGIEVNLNAGESTTLEFTVTVNDLGNNTPIRNVATIDDEPTNEVQHKYVEPIIEAEKSYTTENSLGYVVEGEKITYTITVINDGGLSGNAKIQDYAPEGTTFVDGSIKVNGSGDDNYTETDLNTGIEVNVPAHGNTTLSFEVTVNGLEDEELTKQIRNTAIVNEEDTNEVTTTVNKPNVIGTKESNPASGETVENGEEITYIIRLTNEGTAPDTVTVKDSIPAGTEFVEGSIKIGEVAQSSLTAENLSNGIDVLVGAKGTNTVEFKVKVVDNDTLENGEEITNQATVNDTPTNEITHKYIEPIIDAVKTQTTQNSLDYVVEGETITYTITVTNTGDLGKDVTVRDNIPAGTTFISDSIVIVENGTQKQGTFTESNLEDGIKVNVGAQNTTTITFQVTVNELPQGIYQEGIVNGAVVDEEPTNDVRIEVHKPHIVPSKTAEPEEGTRVTKDNPITYTITVRNDGTAPTTTTVKDTIPEGTTFVPGSIKVGGESKAELTQDNLSQGIDVEVPEGQANTVEFQVIVNDLNNGDPITNIAYADEDPTEEVEHTYIEPIISSIKESETENGLGYLVEGETITYTITVTNSGDLGKEVTIQDTIPEGSTFVAESIKVNGEPRTELTQENLSQGIQEYVNAKDEITVSFEVTVNNLLEGELRKEIVNTALVDNEPTDPVTDIVNKADVKGEKTSVPPSGETVEAGEEITYTITVRNDGTAPETAIVKDTIPTGTTFVEGSIAVEDSQETYELADLTTTGIEVSLNPDESKTVEFKVKVQDLDNGTKIRNVATVDDEPTNNTEHTYVEPIISGSKSFETENGLDYAVEGETITYTITATNTGDAEGTVKVSDQIPEGTTFVPESITVGEESRTELTQDNLQAGIDVTVPARGETTVSFKVTVNDLPAETYEGTIENIAVVDGKETNEVTEEIHKPNITAIKESEPESGKEVTAGNTITYKINLRNQGTAPGETIVKDEIPEGTTFVTRSIKLDGEAIENDAEDLANGIRVDLESGESKVLEFTVTVNDLGNNTQIRNVASIDDEPTNEVTHKYVEPIISSEKSVTTEKGLDYVGEGETITYTVKVTNTGDLDKNVIVKDTIPEGTTFVEGSINIVENGTEKEGTFTKDDLESGIEVNVGAQNETSLTFQVTVNDLTEGTYEETIRNTALVDETPTNEVTNEVNKAHVRIGKTSEPASGETVTANDEIRYVIVLENTEGTAPITLNVKDSIPEGTTFVENSIRVNEIDLQNTLEDLTTNGINVLVPAGQTRTVEFKVKVQDLDNGYIIRNKATVENSETGETKETNEVTHEYVEAVIEANKEMETEKDLSYVIPGEKITYTIRIRNTGDLSKKITVSDSIPEGTEFVEGSVLLNGMPSSVTKEQLEAGIEVEANGNTEQTISFEVTVQEGATEVKNTAVVDETPTNETKIPVISYEKTAEVIRQTEEELPEGTVTAGDKIKYTIRVNNLGEEPVTNITVKDVVPTGTTLSSTSVGAIVNDRNEISWTIDSIAVGESKDVSFEVTVNYDIVENKNITNVATVDDEETNEVETPYDKPEIKEESTIEKTGTEIINSTEDSITYQITYNATIKDFVGEGKVTLIDYLPYEIDVENQYLDGGLYDAKTKTITWEENLGAIDTYTNGDKTVTLEKEITVKYLYGEDAETLEGTIPNRVEGTLQLTQQDSENPTQDKMVLEDKKEDTFETEVQIPTYIIVHHYIEGTNIKVPSKVYGEVVEDERQEGFVGQEYTTVASSNVQENYQVVSNSGNVVGSMTRTPIEVIYYYRLQPGNIVTNTITKDGTDKIINKDDKVSYTISYTGRITNYVGNAKVEIIDYLPFAIDESLSNLNGGLYNPETKTITWTEDLGRVNTYTDGAKEISLSKNIEVVFTEMNYNGTSFINRAQGKITLEETNQEQEIPEASKETETEFIKDITVEKVWDDNEDIKGRRPDSVTVQLTADGNTIYNDQELEKVVLSDENNWTYTFQDLPKYTEQGQEISYSVLETETNPGDLEYYENANIEVFNTDTTATVRVTNSYKLMDTNLDSKIEKTGTELVTSSSQEVSYSIKYNATVTEYIGTGLVTITDYLPYAIDVEKSNLDGGTYDALTNTITWTENIDHINTYTDGDYQVSINKDITVVFTNLDATAKAMVNRVTGRINLYENETTNTVETTYETKIEIPGNVIVKYVDRNTGVEIAESYELQGLAGDRYSTEQKEIYGYTFVESTNNTTGNMIEGTIEVIYYYERTNAGGVIVHYVDEEGNKLVDDVTITGKVADPYRTEQKDIPNYDFVRVEGQTEGELTEGVIEVTYIYKKIPARVIVQHLEKDDTPDDNTDNVVLAEEEIIEGYSGDAYSTARKEIENYKPADPEPENSTGTMTREDIYVTYYYERKPSGIVTVKYVDVDTNEEILRKVELPDGSEEYTSYREQMSGLCGLEYTTEQKDIPYYNFVEDLRPSNAKGIYTEEDIEVIYYYRKQTFNLSVEKLIDRITVNGAEHSLKDGLDQIDVVASKVQETDIVVTYKIVVSNPSEIAGTATAIESIPDFFRVTDGTSTEWTENGKSLEAQVTLQPGETKELTVVLRWIKNSNNFGLQVNTVTLQKVENPANYEETDLSDNTAIAEVIFSVKTGGIDTAIVLGTALIVMVGALIITIYLKERKTK